MTNNRQKKYLSYIILCALLTCALSASTGGCRKNTSADKNKKEFEIDKDYTRGPLTVHIRVDKAKLTIADTLLLEFEAGIENGFEVKMPKIDSVLENFGIVDWNNLGKRIGDNNKVVSTYRYRLEPFLSGTYALPAFTFEFYDANNPEEKKYELITEPVEIEVSSLLGEQVADLKIADLETVVSMPAEPSYWWIWLACAAIVTGGAIFWFKRRSRQIREMVRIFKPAHQIAYDRLRELIARDLVKAGKIKEFYECISDILRHYIEHRFDLKAPERTTEEFLAELAITNVLDKPDKQRLAEFLQHCDMVKFAKYSPTTEQIQKTFDLVKNFIETTKSDEKKIDITETKSQPAEAVRA